MACSAKTPAPLVEKSQHARPCPAFPCPRIDSVISRLWSSGPHQRCRSPRTFGEYTRQQWLPRDRRDLNLRPRILRRQMTNRPDALGALHASGRDARSHDWGVSALGWSARRRPWIPRPFASINMERLTLKQDPLEASVSSDLAWVGNSVGGAALQRPTIKRVRRERYVDPLLLILECRGSWVACVGFFAWLRDRSYLLSPFLCLLLCPRTHTRKKKKKTHKRQRRR